MAYLRSVDMPFLFQLQFTTPQIFWLLFCILLGIGYAFLLYQPGILKSSVSKILFGLRCITVAVIAFLLFAPMMKFTGKTVEKPLIILAHDNSASISISKPAGFNLDSYTTQFKNLEKLLSKDYEIKSFTFGAVVKAGLNADYTESLSDINSIFKHINDQYANRNIGAVILSTDGIYNHGGNPEYEARNLKAPIYSVALGDSVPKKDLLISNVNYNNIVYLENDFQIEVAVEAFQSKGTQTRLTVSGPAGNVYSQNVPITSDDFRLNVPVKLTANKKGIQRYNVNVSAISGELSTQNNIYSLLVEVIDGSNKVAIIANSPHPDISALKQSIEINKNYEAKVVFAESFRAADVRDAGLVILHQLPSTSVDMKSMKQALNQKPVWYILGAQSSPLDLSGQQDLLSITTNGGIENVTARLNPDFHDFTLTDQTKTILENFAPLAAPFGNYVIKNEAVILLNQQVGKLVTDKPLLFFSKQSNPKMAVLAGEGIWRWRLENFRETGTHQAVDELVSKVVQYLVSKDDKRKFRVYPSKTSYDQSERVILNAELYNESYELVNAPDVSLIVKGKSKTYPYLFSRTANGYILDAGTLPAGEYTFSAATQLGESKYSAAGRFLVLQQQAEYRQTTANHQLLYNLAAINDGEVIYPSNLKVLAHELENNELIKSISYEDKRYEELISLKLICFLIILLLTVEWFLRKRNAEI